MRLFQKISEVRGKANRSIIANQIFIAFLWIRATLLFSSDHFFLWLWNTTSSSFDQNSSFDGVTIVLPHSLVIQIDILSHTWAVLLLLRFWTMKRMSFSSTSNRNDLIVHRNYIQGLVQHLLFWPKYILWKNDY